MGPEKITPEMFNKLVNLAALGLEEGEAEYLREELNHQLAAVKELSEIQVDPDVEEKPHGIDCMGLPPRTDKWIPYPNPEKILALAPEQEQGMIVSPDSAKLGGGAA
ncbi:MAG: Asp-tRNA(Asn)/Glu-tRNA(Gln) amidotransferase subunit GatC [Anaerolineaceae bacterium]|nr:Asp-tRNA(Asn)/Glu-tRNA(Gln) amidotransferase subunit GatC [Anaerolineaceae bacterium]